MFLDRTDAGQRLSRLLVSNRNKLGLADNATVVVGLPRGGLPVAFEVATALGAPLDVILVRKLGVPAQPELAMGALGESGVRVLDQALIDQVRVTPAEVDAIVARELAELQRRAHRYRSGRRRLQLKDRVVVIVDDGVATGSTAKAACQVARSSGATRVVLASPVAPVAWKERLAGCADAYVAVTTPADFHYVAQAYRNFPQLTDEAVVDYLERSHAVTNGVLTGDGDDAA